MASRNKKQTPGVYQRLNKTTQLHEERQNRSLRRKRKAAARKAPGEARKLYKEYLTHRTIKASRLYETQD